jgi:regulatory protein
VPPRSSRGTASKPAVPALDAGLRLLARRAHSRVELRRKLGRRGYAEADVEAAVARLAAEGYLDDSAFAEGHVRRRSRSLGPLALSAELANRGVDRRVAEGALSRFSPDAQLEAATALAARLAGHRTFAGYKALLDSVGPKLLRRGFASAVAREACRALWSRTPDTSSAHLASAGSLDPANSTP